ncbi:MAG: envelope stress response membrane protein PspB [Zymomonas mobilis]|uniref:Phage shock protein B n=1 Tax=Zymomonas mobilis TaxID=542 RepID=A0A542W1M3_ZYMMB|nr:envelope stress response membrane protein PspB [Zymomonas mobilis]TQL17453.1 phage shock protein B [Zymomonas mobilis]
MDSIAPIAVCFILFIGVPWIFLHYITQWKKSSGISAADEHLIEELYESACKLEERLQTIERIIAAEKDSSDNNINLSK